MITAVERLVAELRRYGARISVAERADALGALRHTNLGDRAAVRAVLSATLVKSVAYEGVFAMLFDLYFGTTEGAFGPGAPDRPDRPIAGLDDEGIRDLVVHALRTGDTLLLRAAVAVMVTRHAGFRPGRAVAGTYYLFRTMKAIDADGVLARLAADGTELSGFDRRLFGDEQHRRLERLRQEVEAEIRRRLVTDRGADDVARTLRHPLPEDAEFLTASAEAVEELQSIIGPLAREAAARLERRRLGRARGALDIRRTVRKSLSTGGTPVDPVFRPPRPAKPELVILADISGSVAPFAAFTLQLAAALRGQFARVRSFVFVDGLDEVTAIFAESADLAAAAHRINVEGCGVWLDGRSDYGNAFATFAERHLNALHRRTTVLVLGDARSNYRAPRAAEFGALSAHAGHVYWLNPEPAAAWNGGDSVMREYARACDRVVECRNVRQLRAFVERLGDRP